MTVLVWVAAVLGVLVALTMVIVLGALLSWLRIEGQWAPGAASGCGRWGVIEVEVDQAADRLVVRLLGWTVARTSLRRDRSPAADGDAADDRSAPKKPRKRTDRVRISFAGYRRLARTGWREAHRAWRHLHVDRWHVEAVFASDDPAWTGEVYGFGCALLGALDGTWPGADVRWAADFTTTEPRGAAELALRLQPVRLVPAAARLGWTYWQERRRSLRRA